MSILEEIDNREHWAREMLVERAGVTLDELRLTAAVLSKIGAVTLDDLQTGAGFNLLPDGSVGSINPHTAEYRRYAELRDLVDDSRRLGHSLGRAETEARRRWWWRTAGRFQ